MSSIEKILDTIIADNALHARWLNTLSYLEHVGTRKIHKTQSRPDMTDLIIRHASEEARHAHFFKRMAEKLDPESVKDYNYSGMLCGFSAYKYFQSLDSMVEKSIMKIQGTQKADPFICYLYVTTLVEERAGWLYPVYEERLKKAESEITLTTVIQEEVRHLEDMHSAMGQVDDHWEERMEEFRKKELIFYNRFFSKLSDSI